MIINVRGCSGSGKSYVGKRLFDEFGPPVEEVRTTDYFGRRRPKLVAQVLPGGLCLAGRYVMGKSCLTSGKGWSYGVDGFYPVEELQQMLTDLSRRYPFMLMESLMLSGTKQRWLDWSRARLEEDENPVTFATLDTPLEKCLTRIQSRNGGNPVKEHTIDKHRKQVMRCHDAFVAGGADAFMLDHEKSYEIVRNIFLAGGWDPTSEAIPSEPRTVGSLREQAQVQVGDPQP